MESMFDPASRSGCLLQDHDVTQRLNIDPRQVNTVVSHKRSFICGSLQVLL